MLWSAYILGLAGSLHCIGMCGPIALALPGGHKFGSKLIVNRTLYNLGRIITYTSFGLVFGMIGQGLVIAGFQRWLSITAGIVLLLIVLISGTGRLESKWMSMINPVWNYLKQKMGVFFKKKDPASMLMIGMLNGLLPCGFVYVALAGAAATGSIQSGAIYMLAFGMGTLPAMLILSLGGNWVNLKFRGYINKFVPVIAIVFACIFIVRGLNLGIPYLSPKIEINTTSVKVPDCH